jgi:hypothetical protein
MSGQVIISKELPCLFEHPIMMKIKVRSVAFRRRALELRENFNYATGFCANANV